jgi:hypothetical protein
MGLTVEFTIRTGETGEASIRRWASTVPTLLGTQASARLMFAATADRSPADGFRIVDEVGDTLVVWRTRGAVVAPWNALSYPKRWSPDAGGVATALSRGTALILAR